jgi:hypothetical protein
VEHRLLRRVLQLAVGRAADEVRARLRDGALDDQPAGGLRLAGADRAGDREDAYGGVVPEPRGAACFGVVYNLAMKYNRGLDRDKDGIACEKR